MTLLLTYYKIKLLQDYLHNNDLYLSLHIMLYKDGQTQIKQDIGH